MKIIRIISKKDGFRRAGKAHPAEPRDYPAKAFDKDQLAELQAEPMLVVQELDVPDTEDSDAKGKTAKDKTANGKTGDGDKAPAK